jgi:hypothetical protein
MSGRDPGPLDEEARYRRTAALDVASPSARAALRAPGSGVARFARGA